MGRNEERRAVSLAENGRANVAVGGLAEHARDELVRTGCVNCRTLQLRIRTLSILYGSRASINT